MFGDEEKIRVFADPWIKGKENYMLDNTVATATRNLRVCELFTPGVKQWDEQKVNNLISNCDAKIILAIPIPRCQVADRILGCTLWMVNTLSNRDINFGMISLVNADVTQLVKVG